MELMDWLPEAASAVLAGAALLYAARAHWLAKRADNRAERAEQTERVRLEIVRAPAKNSDPHVFALVNIGPETVSGVEVDPASVKGITFMESRWSETIVPAGKNIFSLGSNDADLAHLPDALRITFSSPFEGERFVAVPKPEDESWTYFLTRPYGHSS